MTIWIFVETGIRGLSWRQVLPLVGGCLPLLLIVVLLGGVGRLPRTPLPARQMSGPRRTGQ